MTKTVLELANELDVTKQAIQYQMKKINKNNLSKRYDGAYLISEEGQNLIREYMGFEAGLGNESTDKDHQKTSKMADKTLSEQNITILQKELQEKNDQIEKLQELLKEQQNLLSQQQQLSLQSNQQIQHLQLELSKDAKNNNNEVSKKRLEKEQDLENNTNNLKEKKGFFSRFFNNKL